MAVITYPLNGIDFDAAAAELYHSTRTSGVYANSDNLDASLTDSRQITIGKGIAWIKNDEFTGKCVGVTDEVVLTFDAADSILDRIDRVVLRFDRAANASSIVIKKGTLASSPAAPARVATPAVYELVLYDVAIPHGTTSITGGNITDQRANKDLCGLMRDGVSGDVPSHAATHSSSGDDPITPVSIGAQPKIVTPGILKSDGAGNLSTATGGTDYEVPWTNATVLPASGTALTNRCRYRVSAAVGAYQFAAPAGSHDIWIRFTTSASPAITFSGINGYATEVPTWAASATYEMTIVDGYVAVVKLVSA